MTPYYKDELVTLYHGDALEIMPNLASGSVDAVVTDPPYVIGAVSAGSLGSKSGGWADMMNSALWFAAWYREVDRLLKNSGAMWTFLNWRTLPVVMRAAVDAGLPITSCAVWDKEWIGPGGTQGLRPSHELIALMCKPDYSVPDRGVADVIKHKVGSHKPHGHPAEKPEGLLSRILSISGVEAGSVVLDPFLGSGTTLVAAKSRGLLGIGIEAEERYCEMAARRLGQQTLGLTA